MSKIKLKLSFEPEKINVKWIKGCIKSWKFQTQICYVIFLLPLFSDTFFFCFSFLLASTFSSKWYMTVYICLISILALCKFVIPNNDRWVLEVFHCVNNCCFTAVSVFQFVTFLLTAGCCESNISLLVGFKAEVLGSGMPDLDEQIQT